MSSYITTFFFNKQHIKPQTKKQPKKFTPSPLHIHLIIHMKHIQEKEHKMYTEECTVFHLL